MANYVHKYMEKHFTEKDIKEQILSITPVPNNLKKPPVLDGHLKELLADHSQVATIQFSKTRS